MKNICYFQTNSKPGILTGIDKPFNERTYTVSAVVYGLYILNNNPNVDALKKIVAEIEMDHFTNALPANGLTGERRK